MMPCQHGIVMHTVCFGKPTLYPVHKNMFLCKLSPTYTHKVVPRGLQYTWVSPDALLPRQQSIWRVGVHPLYPRVNATRQVSACVTSHYCHNTHVTSWVVAAMSASCCHISSMMPRQLWDPHHTHPDTQLGVYLHSYICHISTIPTHGVGLHGFPM